MIREAPVLLTGATGFLGGVVARRLAADGRRVRVLVRRRPSEHLCRVAEVVRGDLSDADALAAAAAGCEAVVHAAALIDGPGEQLAAVNVAGTRRLAEATARAGVRRFVYVSTAAVFGHGRPIGSPAVGEDDRPRPADAYGRSKLAGEQSAAEALGGRGELVVLRPTWIYGPGDPRTERLFRAVAAGLPQIGPGRARNQPLFVDDCAAAVAAALDADPPPDRPILLAGPRPMTMDDFTRTVARSVGGARPIRHIPAPLARVGATLLRMLCAAAGRRPPITPRQLAFYLADHVYDIAPAERRLGWTPAVDFPTGAARVAEGI